jgi:hypothetical protein
MVELRHLSYWHPFGNVSNSVTERRPRLPRHMQYPNSHIKVVDIPFILFYGYEKKRNKDCQSELTITAYSKSASERTAEWRI